MRNIIEYQDLIWVDIVEPTEQDVEYLKNNFRLHPLTLSTIIPTVHHTDLEIFRNYLFIILHHPELEKDGEMKIHELDIIAGKNYLVTSHYGVIRPLNSIFESCLKSQKTKEDFMKRGISYLLFLILKQLLREKLTKIDEAEDEIDLVQKEIFLREEKETAKKISFLKRKVLTYWRVIEPQKMIFESLKNVISKIFSQESIPYYFVLFRIHREIEDTLRNSKETIESLERTNHILVTLELDEIIKILTIFSAIILPLNLLASIWGMNTGLPIANTPFGFWLIILIMLITCGATIIYFKIRKWL